MARKLMYPPSLALVMTAAWICSCCALPLSTSTAAAAQPLTPAQPTSPELPNGGVPAGSSAVDVPAATASQATASKKFPLAKAEVYVPAAEVASALPVPIPEEFPSAAALGFGGAGYGDQTVPGGGLGGFGGGPGGFGLGSNGCCGGPGGFGYNNGPLFFNSAPSFRSVAAANLLMPLLLVACVSAMFNA